MNANLTLNVVLPAYNEEGNIAETVNVTLTYLNSAKSLWEDYRIIIVNDGSKDKTGEIADQLAVANPKILVCHQPNGGYGQALRSGFIAATKTGMDWTFFMDSDGQFLAEKSLEKLLQKVHAGFNFIAGIRTNRADRFIRKVNGHLWTLICTTIMGIRLHDLDCASKLFLTSHLGKADTFFGDGSTINAELVLRAKHHGAKIAEIGVPHYPRTAGSPTGASLKFILKSFRGLLRLRLAILMTTYQI